MSKKPRKELKIMTTIVPDIYKHKFRKIGQELAECLSFFSLDLCGIISSYLLVGMAKKDELPKRFMDIKIPRNGNPFNMAIHPFDNSIWLSSSNGINVLDSNGNHQKTIISDIFYQQIAIHINGTVFVTHHQNIHMYDYNGIFMKKLDLFYQGTLLSDSKYVYIESLNGLHRMDDQGCILKTFKYDDSRVFRWIAGIDNVGRFIIQSLASGSLLLDMDACTLTKFLDFSANTIVMDEIGNIYCLGLSKDQIKVLDPKGQDLTEFTFNLPMSICIDKQGYIYVRDEEGVHVLGFSLS